MLRKPFAIAIAVSVLWHLFLGTAFTVVVTPVALSPVSRFSEVNFLGPLLLEDISLKTSIEIKPGYAGARPERKAQAQDRFFYAQIEKPKKRVPEQRGDDLAILKERKFSESLVALYDKSTAPFLYARRQEYEPKVSDLMGQVVGRKVLYSPELPATVKWPQKSAQDLDIDSFDMMLRFYVSANGDVESVEKIYSSGYQEVDIIGIRYIKMWQFEPLKGAQPQMGMIRINFRQK